MRVNIIGLPMSSDSSRASSSWCSRISSAARSRTSAPLARRQAGHGPSSKRPGAAATARATSSRRRLGRLHDAPRRWPGRAPRGCRRRGVLQRPSDEQAARGHARPSACRVLVSTSPSSADLTLPSGCEHHRASCGGGRLHPIDDLFGRPDTPAAHRAPGRYQPGVQEGHLQECWFRRPPGAYPARGHPAGDLGAEVKPSLVRMCSTCPSTVRGDSDQPGGDAAVAHPRATSSATSRSRR